MIDKRLKRKSWIYDEFSKLSFGFWRINIYKSSYKEVIGCSHWKPYVDWLTKQKTFKEVKNE